MRALWEHLRERLGGCVTAYQFQPWQSDFVGRGRELEEIREFFREPTSRGGILLVSGPRGSGKTRLVDEALNGDRILNARRPRRVTLRAPRMLARILLKVDVDPYFPIVVPTNSGSTDSNPVAKPDSTSPLRTQEEWRTLILLQNIVFALCSNLDPRRSVRRYGRTLRERLGFWRYWFSPTGLYRSPLKRSLRCTLLCLAFGVPLAYICFAFGVERLWPSHMFQEDFSLLFTSPTLTAIVSIFFFSWMLLRQKDWSALTRIGSRLYDLTHAQSMRKEDHQTIQRTMQVATNSRTAGLVGLVVASLLVLAIPFKTPQETKSIAHGLAVLIAGAGSFGLLWSNSRKNVTASTFGPENSTWMIGLLRRYLFLLHRCGIEPILVFDELDKFEPKQFQDALGDTLRDALGGAPGNAQLDRFVETLLRLKHALGAEFLMVLIGGPILYQRLVDARTTKTPSGMSGMATLVRGEIVIGPVDLAIAREFFGGTSEDVGNLSIQWLESRGNFASMYRQRAQEKQKNKQLEQEDNDSTERLALGSYLAASINTLWDAEAQSDYLGFQGVTDEWKIRGRYGAPWVQAWIHAGMLDLADELLNRLELSQLWYAGMRDEERSLVLPDRSTLTEALVLVIDQPEKLLSLGRILLYTYLLNRHAQSNGENGLPPEEESGPFVRVLFPSTNLTPF